MTTAPPVRVLIVDDQPLVRGGFRMLVDSQPDLTVVGDVGDGVAAVDAVRPGLAVAGAPDVILMDVRMPQMDGSEATREILALAPQVRIIVLTTFDLDEYALEGIQAGASGFLLKDARPESPRSYCTPRSAGGKGKDEQGCLGIQTRESSGGAGRGLLCRALSSSRAGPQRGDTALRAPPHPGSVLPLTCNSPN